MWKTVAACALGLGMTAVCAKALVVSYSFTGNADRIAAALVKEIKADQIKIELAQKGIDYAANYYSIGSDLVGAIRKKPDTAASYPKIDPVKVDWSQYSTVIIATPLWWSNMAAPMQTFLFENGKDMSGKKIGLIVTSASSGISGVERDAKRLIPGGDFYSPSLWTRSSQSSSAGSMLADWLKRIHYDEAAK